MTTQILMHSFFVLTCNAVVAFACLSSNTYYSPVECVLRIPCVLCFKCCSSLCLLSVFLRMCKKEKLKKKRLKPMIT